MLDIPSISAVVAAVGVIVGVVFTALQLRDLVKTRQTDLVIRLYSKLGSKEMLEAWDEVRSREYTDLNGYLKKYSFAEVNEITTFFEGIGVLLHRKLIDISLVDDLFSTHIKWSWEWLKPMAEDLRAQSERPQIGKYFEYAYNEMQKREQRLQQIQQ